MFASIHRSDFFI